MKESSFFINFPPVLSLHVSERKEEKERKVKLSRDVLPAPLNADVDLFVLLRNLHLRPGWSLHVYLKSHLTEKDTAITLKSESLLEWLTLHPNHFSDLSSQAKKATSISMGSWWPKHRNSAQVIFTHGLCPASRKQYMCVMGMTVFQDDKHLSFPTSILFFPRYFLDIDPGFQTHADESPRIADVWLQIWFPTQFDGDLIYT